MLGRGRWRRFGACLHIIGREEAFFFFGSRAFDDVAEPPSIVICLLDQDLISFLESQISNLILLSRFMLCALFLSLLLVALCLFVVKFIIAVTC